MSTDLLTVILDCNPHAWNKREPRHGFITVVEQMMIFLNAFLLLSRGNRIAIIAAHTTQSRFLYPPPKLTDIAPSTTRIQATSSSGTKFTIKKAQPLSAIARSDVMAQDERKEQFGQFQPTLLAQLQSLITEYAESTDTITLLSGAMSLGLCYIHRMRSSHPKLRARLLCLSLSSDDSSQYIPLMNSIFSADKQEVAVDVCMLGEHDSLFLQQAAHLTKGVYQKTAAGPALLQSLLQHYLSDTTLRHHLITPEQDTVDYRAACFCHQRVIDQGFVCPVCLSIFCRSQVQCITCGTRFAIPLTAQTVGRVQRTISNGSTTIANGNTTTTTATSTSISTAPTSTPTSTPMQTG